VIRQTLPLISDITTDNFEEFLSLSSSVLIAYLEEDDQESRATFKSFAESHQDQFLFGVTSDISLAKVDLSETALIILYSLLDEVNAVFRDKFEVDMIQHFINTHSKPLVGKFSMPTYF